MKEFFAPLGALSAFNALREAVRNGKGTAHVVGAAEAQKAHMIAALLRETGKQGVVISWSESAARLLAEELSFFSDAVTLLPQGDLIEKIAESTGYTLPRARAAALYRILAGDTAVMSVGCLLDFILPAKKYKTITISVGEAFTNFSEILAEIGYRRVPMVEGPGQFSVRGGIVDLYPPTEEQPVRIEFFDTEVDSIRVFDLSTQQSTGTLSSVTIIPAAADGDDGDILDYFDDNVLFILDEPQRVSEGAEAYSTSIRERVASLVMRGSIVNPKEKYIHDYQNSIDKMMKKQLIGFSGMSRICPDFKPDINLHIAGITLASYAGKMRILAEDVARWKENGFYIYILAGNASRAKGISEALTEAKIPSVSLQKGDTLPRGTVGIYSLPLNKGFIYSDIKTVFISGSDVFVKQNKKKFAAVGGAKALRSFDELSIGDYVVHRVHGIGQFVAMDKIETDGVERDYLKLSYKNNDFLYVPVTQLNLLYKYSHAGADAPAPRVSRLGGGDWQKTKNNVKHSVRELAIKLIDLYAARSQIEGHAFLKDTPWQIDFENEFPFDETPDQLACIAEVKKDMESPRPMDRLLCGDVGYGKTEVAIRAAFKCIMEGLQCMYLVPTTILAAQHYNHFVKRMENFPVRVEMLSRFRTAAQQKKIIEGLKNGEVDVVIGTHRLLGNDISFKRLGLLIIDEEQRFGVGHKEKIKDIKKGVDVLTLTATPIPRTLNMAMTGIRDMSVLANPPEDRQAIQTYVFEYDAGVVQDALERELARGGQIYYVYNRVQGIHRVADSIRKMVPTARIAVAHGRMNEDELEVVMSGMMDGEYDILVSTTIIESGIDIPNVNTLIVENADHMGLAQLYQLRGRVGRSDKVAYAYLTFKRDKALSEIAEKRLLAIKEFTALGSGFKIALRDLEIRGAGNLLGPEQHGFMASVGYDMYVRLLEEAVSEMRGEERKTEAVIDLIIDAGIPDDFVEDPRLRLEAYRMVADITSDDDAEAVIAVLIDRYGDPPPRVMRLIDVSLLRVYAGEAGIGEVTESGGKIIIYFDKTPNMENLSRVMEENRGKLLFNAGERPYIALREGFLKNKNDTEKLKKLLKDLKI
ncbi:MAG: transcription-repair coupling factor [Ruminococcaceae bacterium]|nr:transcription-repair coupling factor [Oscillospiraceae bacterium]